MRANPYLTLVALVSEFACASRTCLFGQDQPPPLRNVTAIAAAGPIVEIPVSWALDDWEKYAAGKVAALRASLGQFPKPPAKQDVRITGTVKGEGFVIDNLVFQSRPGLWVTANLYRPAEPPASMPGILICHAHHTPKEHGELQDMGMTWARAGWRSSFRMRRSRNAGRIGRHRRRNTSAAGWHATPGW